MQGLIKLSSLDLGVLIEESGEGGGGDCAGRTPPDFPMLESAELSWESRSNKNIHRLELAKIVVLAPSLEAHHNGSDTFHCSRYFEFRLSREEPLEGRCSNCVRRRACYLPLLKSAQLVRQT